MWEQGKSLLKYGLKRGSRFSDSENSKNFYLDVPTGGDTYTEVSALGTSLDMMKQHAEDLIVVYKHANNKHNHQSGRHGDTQDNANGNSDEKFFSGTHTNSYDPSVRIILKSSYSLMYMPCFHSIFNKLDIENLGYLAIFIFKNE